jgi:RNA recognition motif-containing protein
MKIFVGGLSRDATEEDVRNAFSAYGNVASVAVLKDKFTGEPRGFGFVEMDSKAEAEAAINGLNGTQLKGRTLTVNEARPKAERPRGGGFGGGGGGGGRGPWGGGGGGERRGGGGGGRGGFGRR